MNSKEKINERGAGRKSVRDGVTVKIKIPKDKRTKLKEFAKELINEPREDKI